MGGHSIQTVGVYFISDKRVAVICSGGQKAAKKGFPRNILNNWAYKLALNNDTSSAIVMA